MLRRKASTLDVGEVRRAVANISMSSAYQSITSIDLREFARCRSKTNSNIRRYSCLVCSTSDDTSVTVVKNPKDLGPVILRAFTLPKNQEISGAFLAPTVTV